MSARVEAKNRFKSFKQSIVVDSEYKKQLLTNKTRLRSLNLQEKQVKLHK